MTNTEIKGLMNEGFGRIEKRMDKVDGSLVGLGKRMKTMEIWRANVTGKFAVIVAVVSVTAAFAVDWAKSKLIKG